MFIVLKSSLTSVVPFWCHVASVIWIVVIWRKSNHFYFLNIEMICFCFQNNMNDLILYKERFYFFFQNKIRFYLLSNII